jgi:hypothetical protein
MCGFKTLLPRWPQEHLTSWIGTELLTTLRVATTVNDARPSPLVLQVTAGSDPAYRVVERYSRELEDQQSSELLTAGTSLRAGAGQYVVQIMATAWQENEIKHGTVSWDVYLLKFYMGCATECCGLPSWFVQSVLNIYILTSNSK